ncbi:U3 small nucleolar ribonucleoprotein protein MPP10-like [Pollicipes pollicipes]|uniref:U3 small nucleolar ribonucleoprotein protein MPP10-like n=1 Tax=Pollicipes pollicipes TaxID=41117 RepID=UPI0018854118|nr:U3 small nucleolar ribonucleoprotein protein MPP10-like [Pollicipes pollicipes]
MEKLITSFVTLTKKAENFLRSDQTSAEGFKGVTKEIFDIGVSCLSEKSSLPIQELFIEGFDQEQIWQEVELLNGLEWPALSREVSRVTARSGQLALTTRAAGHEVTPPTAVGRRPLAGEAVSDSDDSAGHGDAPNINGPDGEVDEDDLEDGFDGPAGEDDSEDEGAESDEDGPGSGEEEEPLPERPHAARSTVDDRFFKLGELEQFLELQDRQFERERARRPADADEPAGPDLFTADAGEERRAAAPGRRRADARERAVEGEEEEEDAMPMFSDFFDPPDDGKAGPPQPAKGKRLDLLASDSEGEDVADILGIAKKSQEPKSTLEIRQERLKSRISQLEEQNLAEKPWQQRGETSAAQRHENALLEEYVDFEQTRRAPETTAEVTAEVERLILRRVRDRAWDDVERKVKPVTDPYEYKKRLLLDQEKSKLSLAQIYEQEYLKQKADAEQKPEVDLSLAHDEVEDIPKEHEEIRRMMAELSAKLDTLTNFHYMPKQSSAEVRIVSKLPAISMEEVTPLGSSNATLLAPEEIKDKRRSQLLAKEERSDTDKKRERRKKKRRQSVKARDQERRERQPAGARAGAAGRRLAEAQVARAEKRGLVTRADDKGGKKALKSSTAFFSQLQDQVTAQVAGVKPPKKKRKVTTSAEVARMRL